MKVRDWLAVWAHWKKGGPHAHRNEPKGGTQNELHDYLQEWEDEKASSEPEPPLEEKPR